MYKVEQSVNVHNLKNVLSQESKLFQSMYRMKLTLEGIACLSTVRMSKYRSVKFD